ncbi:MAG: BrnT family toxin [Methyloceanibacter sp.]
MAVEPSFEWDEARSRLNEEKHGVAFEMAQRAFLDEHRIIAEDLSHSAQEQRFYCFGKVNDGILTVRFTWREGRIRIFGAGYWRKGKRIYERENKKVRRGRDRGGQGD